jgi:hypothetical protein
VASLSAYTAFLSCSTSRKATSADDDYNQAANSQAAAISFYFKLTSDSLRLCSKSSKIPRTLSATVPALPDEAFSSASSPSACSPSSSLARARKALI